MYLITLEVMGQGEAYLMLKLLKLRILAWLSADSGVKIVFVIFMWFLLN